MKRTVLKNILDLADNVSGWIGLPGASAAISVAEKVLKMIDEVKTDFDEDDAQELIATREQLAAQVTKHSHETEAKLRG